MQGKEFANYEKIDNGCYKFICDESTKTSLVVTFDSDGGTKVASQTVSYNDVAIEPVSPTKEGYDFSGWKLNGADYDFSSKVISNITLKAYWVAKQPQSNNCQYRVNLPIKEKIFVEIKSKFLLEEYKENVTINSYCKITYKDVFNNDLANTDIIGTCSSLNIYQNKSLIKKYTNIVKGDITGDGEIDLDDVVKGYLYYKERAIIDEDCFLLAGDVNNDDKFDLADVSKMYRYYKGIIPNLD